MSELKLGEPISVFMSEGKLWILETVTKIHRDGSFETWSFHLGLSKKDWQRGILPSLIPEGLRLFLLGQRKIHISGESWHESRENYYKLLEAAPKPTDK